MEIAAWAQERFQKSTNADRNSIKEEAIVNMILKLFRVETNRNLTLFLWVMEAEAPHSHEMLQNDKQSPVTTFLGSVDAFLPPLLFTPLQNPDYKNAYIKITIYV